MGITLNGTLSFITAPSTVSVSGSYDCGAGADGLIVVGWNDTAPANVVNVSFGGSNLSFLYEENNDNFGLMTSMFLLTNPPSGSQTLLGTWTGSGSKGLIAQGLKGLNQSTPNRTANTATSASGADPPSLTNVNSISNDFIMNFIASFPGSGAQTAPGIILFGSNLQGGAISGNLAYQTAITSNTVVGWNATGIAYSFGTVALIPAAGIPPNAYTVVSKIIQATHPS